MIVLYINGDAHQVMRGWSTPHAGGPLSCTYTDLCAEVFPGAPMADGRPGEKNAFFLSHLCIKTIFLPRQARDKHRESTQKQTFFL